MSWLGSFAWNPSGLRPDVGHRLEMYINVGKMYPSEIVPHSVQRIRESTEAKLWIGLPPMDQHRSCQRRWEMQPGVVSGFLLLLVSKHIWNYGRKRSCIVSPFGMRWQPHGNNDVRTLTYQLMNKSSKQHNMLLWPKNKNGIFNLINEQLLGWPTHTSAISFITDASVLPGWGSTPCIC